MLKKTVIAAAVVAATSSLAMANGGTFVPVETKGAQLESGYYAGIGIDVNYDPNQRRLRNGGSWGYPITPEVFGGYGVHWTNMLYTGLELFGTASGNRQSNYGARFMPGIKIFNNTIAFANVGYVRGSFYPFSYSTQANGIQFGGGLQTKLVDNISLRGGWNRNYFSAYSAHPKVDQFYLSAIYHFTV